MREFYHNLLYWTQGVAVGALTFSDVSLRPYIILSAISVFVTITAIIVSYDISGKYNKEQIAYNSLLSVIAPFGLILIGSAAWYGVLRLVVSAFSAVPSTLAIITAMIVPTLFICVVMAAVYSILRNYIKTLGL